jgi:precorrin-2 dehydrogenase / sirohydrochlorin ferrochelatase
MSAKFPIFLELTDRVVVIVGGGNVAARKARSLLAGSGSSGSVRVRAIAPQFSDAMPREVERIVERYRPEHLDDAFLVFAATDSPDVNESVVRDARARRVLVSRADEPDDGDFIVPAVHRDEAITIAVSTNNPALSAFVRDELASRFDPAWSALADEMQSLRPLINASKLAATRRTEILRSLASREALDVLTASGPTALRDWLIARYPDLDPILHARSR